MWTPRLATIALILAAVALTPLQAQAIVAPGGRTLFRGATLLRSFVDVSHASFADEQGSGKITRYVVPVALVYGFAPKWSLIVSQPFVAVDTNLGGERQRSNGLADSRFLFQYDGLYSRNSPGGLTRLAAVGGVRIPSGADRFSARAAEYSAGLIFQKQTRLKYVFTADIEYTLATESGGGFDRGDQVRFDAVPGYFLLSRGKAGSDAGWLRRFYESVFRNGAYLIVELNGTWQARARNREAVLADSGGTTLSISPGIQYFPGESLLLEFSSPIAIVKKLNGTQPKPGSRFIFGLRYLF